MANKKEVIITCNATNVKAVIEGLERGMAALAKEEEHLLGVIKQRGYAENDEKKRLKELEKAMDAMRTNIQKNREETKKFNQVMRDLSGATLKDLKKALQEGKNALNKMSERDPRRAKLVDDLKRIQTQIEKNTGAVKAQGNAFATTAKNLATYMIGFAGFNKLKSLIEGVFQANIKLSDSLANIRKVSGLSGGAINELYRNIARIDSRNTIETLNNLAYTGAKLGIGQNYGVAGLTGFVKAAEQVQMALGEDMGEKALPELSKMIEVMGLIPKYGVEQSMQKAASAIFQLGATSTATGTNIVEFSKRLMGLANVSRISTQDLLALGSASDAMGLMPEVSATAFNKLFTSIQRQHNLIENSLGMAKGTIKQYYDQGRTMDAIVEIFERMNERGNLNLLGNIFKDLGSDGARLVNVMATMADRADILRKHLEVSRNAFNEGEAVIGEYMIQNQTAAALLERASNLWAKAFTNPEGVDMVKEMAQAWYDLSKAMTQSDAMMKSLHSSIQFIADAIRTLITLFPVLLRFAITFGAMFGFKQAILGIGSLITAFRTLYKDMMLATGAMGTLNVVMKSNAFLLAASAIATAVTLVLDYNNAADEAAKREVERQAELKKAFAESKEAVQKSVRPLEVYKQALDNANLSEKQKMEMVKQFRNEYQDYLDYLGIEINSALDLAKAYTQVVKAMKLKKAYEERENYRTQVNGENRMSRIENQAKVEGAARAFGLTDVDKKWLEKNQRLGTNQLYRQLVERKMGAKALQQNGEDITFLYINDKLTNAGTRTSPRAKKRYKQVGSSELYQAIDAYIASYRAEQRTDKEVDAMFNAEFEGLDKFNIDDFNQRVQMARWKRKGTLENEKPDKGAAAAAKQAAAERKKALKLEMDEAQKASTGIISKLEEFYRLQEAAIQDARADGQLTEDQAKEMVRALSIVKNESLATARRAVTSGNSAEWDELKTNVLPTIMSDTSDVSRSLLETIQQVAVDKLHNDLQKFNGSSTVEGLDSRAFFDQMNAKAAGNTREAARLRAKIQNEVEKALLQYQFVDQAVEKMRKDLETMGFVTETYEQFAARMQAGIKEKPATVTSSGRSITDKEAYREMGNKFIQGGIINFRYNIDNQQEAEQWLSQFATTAKGELENWAQAFPELLTWIDLIKRREQGETLGEIEEKALRDAMPAIRNLFNELLNHSDRVNKAIKQAYEHEKQQQDIRFQAAGFTEAEKQTDRSMEMQGKLQTAMGTGQNFWQQNGLQDAIASDPEVQRIQNHIYYRNLEYQDAKQHLDRMLELQSQEMAARKKAGASEEEMNQLAMQQQQDRAGLEQLTHERATALLNETATLAAKVSKEIADRSSTILSLSQPITDFAENAGQKLGDMIFNMESQSQTWNQLWKNMVLAMGKSVIQMGAQWLTQKIQQALFYKQMEADEVMHQSIMTMIALGGAQARLAGEAAINSTRLGVNAATNAAEVGQEVSLATILTALGISKGAAKIIGTLGWWGIPLIAVISSLLMGLLASALSTASSSSSSSSSSTNTKVKLASGMLTYDEGNIGTYQGTDGQSYRATAVSAPADGLVTQPIATTVQGQPALVAERGPEIVIGRRTTRAIMMNEPGLIRYLANYNKNASAGPRYRTFDEGNLDDITTQLPDGAGPAAALTREDAAALTAAIGVFNQTVGQLQQKGIPCYINKYGTGGLIDEVKSGLKFDAKYNGK